MTKAWDVAPAMSVVGAESMPTCTIGPGRIETTCVPVLHTVPFTQAANIGLEAGTA